MLESELINTSVAWQRVTAVIMRQAIGMAKTGNGRNDPTRSSHSYLFTQNLRHIINNSEEALAGHQIKLIISEWQVKRISLVPGNLPLQSLAPLHLFGKVQ